MRPLLVLGLLLVTALSMPLHAQRRDPDWAKNHDPAQGYRWEDEAKKAGLSDEDVAKLAKDKVLVTNEAYKQVFQPYLKSNVSLFITSDSLLNAFHVLYEESILRMEDANARKLPVILSYVWGGIQVVDSGWSGRPELVSAAKRRAQGVIGTAMVLLGMEPKTADAELMALVQAEAARVSTGEGVSKPEWLGPPDPGFMALDYSRYLPRGFYTRSERLQRYFRAVSWLQSVPFRPSREEELLAIFMMGECLNTSCLPRRDPDLEKLREFEGFFQAYSVFVGPEDDWNLSQWWGSHTSEWDELNLEGRSVAEALGFLASEFLEAEKDPKINDQLRFAPEAPGQPVEPCFRVLSARRTPDAVLFQRTTDQDRPCPSGLEVCAALGSAFAREALADPHKEDLLRTIDEARPLFQGRSLYARYLNCLEALLDPAEPDAPPFLSEAPWRTKSCQTALAGWAQLRHTWALQAKQTVLYLGLTDKPPGRVEPDPEFFSRMAELVAATRVALANTGALDLDLSSLAADARALADILEKRDFAHDDRKAFRSLSEEERAVFNRTAYLVECLELAADRSDKEAWFAEMVAKLREAATSMEAGKLPDLPHLREAMAASNADPGPLWERLEQVCRRLEALSHKQLRGIRFSAAEDSFVLHYGEQIAGIMLYGGNSYLTPNDDAPRVVDVFSNPSEGKALEVGIGRPHALWVLYPMEGGELLCKGAVLPYYEFSTEKRLTDAEWRALLDSDGRPPIPAWVAPILGKDGIAPEALRKDH